VNHTLFGSDLWISALDKYTEVTGLTVDLFDASERVVLRSTHVTPLVGLFRDCGFDPGLFSECARRCLKQVHSRPAIVLDGPHGLTVVGTSLMLEGAVVGAAVAGYALAGFSQVTAAHNWAKSAGVPFDRLWNILRQKTPLPRRRLSLHGELLQVLGDALLRENYRTRQYEEAVVKLQAASAAKDEFLAVLSHELRTPLTPILGWASILKKSESLEQAHRAAEAIERNALLQSRMVDDLLDMNRISHGSVTLEVEILDAAALIRTALETVVLDVEKKAIRLDLALTDEPLLIEGDAGRLQQIFSNILANAVKFTPAGESIRVSLRREAGHAVVVVADTGVGIAAEFLPFVFDMFRQQDQGIRREYQGLGVGLALVKQLTELHRGTVTVESAGAGRGTEVTVRLPVAVSAATGSTKADAAGTAAGTLLAGLSLLVVEDSDDTREILGALLEQLGARVSGARDGREALQVIEKKHPDLVLCDLRMPRMDGYEFIRELRRDPSSLNLPVVAMSGLTSEEERQRARVAGFEGHLKKPFGEADVVTAVEAALAQRHAYTA
jgi:signal transduction histidine kinase/CheY-like chemotaxis protein